MTAAYQINAYQPNAYQINGSEVLPAFDGCAFQFDAFQAAPCPNPPVPPVYDGHDGGRKKALKRLKELEDKRIAIVREQAENRKMMIRFAIDPAAKAAHEAKLAAANVTPEVAKIGREAKVREIAKIDAQIARIEKMQKNNAINAAIKQELSRIHSERQLREAEVARQIKQADEELALMMLM